MSKDLKNEYIDMIQSDVPDLWDQISASLPEKQPVAEKKRRTKIYRFSILAAACICIAVLIPVAIHVGGAKGSSKAASKTFATAAAEDTKSLKSMPVTEESQDQDMYEMSAGGAVEEADVEEAAPAESLNAESRSPVRIMNSMNGSTAENAIEEEAAAEEPYYMSQDSPDEVFIENVRIRITGPLEEDGAEGYYLADVLDNTGYLTKGDIIIIQADAESPEAFADGITPGEYTCNLQEMLDENEDTVYLLR